MIAWLKSALGSRVRAVMLQLPARNLVGTIHATRTGVFAISATDTALGIALRRDAAWAEDELAAIRQVAEADARVLFVGAHVGTLAIPVSRHVRQVHAVEANPDTFRLLSANLQLNGVTNVTLHGYAAGEADGEIEFVLSRRNSGGSKRRPVIADPRYTYDNPDLARVPMRRLDEALEGTFEVIVMDCEGSEVFALRGMPRLLAAASHLFVEFLPHHLRNVAGVDADAFCDLVLPHLPHLTIGARRFSGEAARAELRRMFAADQGEDLIHFFRAA